MKAEGTVGAPNCCLWKRRPVVPQSLWVGVGMGILLVQRSGSSFVVGRLYLILPGLVCILELMLLPFAYLREIACSIYPD
jgi:hypothetical protein